MPAAISFIAGVALAGNLAAAVPSRYEFDEPHMGTKVRLVFYAPDQPTAVAAARAAFKRFAEIEQVLSDYRPGSEIMKLCTANDTEPGKAFPINDDLVKVLEIALDVSKRSDGGFDVTIGPLSKLWRETRLSKKLPDSRTLTEAKAKVGWQLITLDTKAKTLKLKRTGMRLDFGGIGKGYAAEETLAILKKHGITSALVAASGDVSVSDAPPGREGWKVEVQPLNPKEPSRILLLKNAAVSTSGDLFQNVEIDGVRYSHVLDPATGLGLIGYRSVTVIAKRGPYADALSKTASILPFDKVEKIIGEINGVEVYLAAKERIDGELKVRQSKLFDAFLVKP